MTEPGEPIDERVPDSSSQGGPISRFVAPTTPNAARFSERLKGPDLLRIGIVLGAFLILLVTAALTIAASPSPSASPSTGAQATPRAEAGGPPGFHHKDGGPAIRGGHGGFGFGQITITAIDGSNLSLKTADGWTRTITVTDSTTITRAGQKIALGDLKVGDSIGFRQTRQSDGSFAIDAIEVVLPHVAGTVTAVSGDGFTVKDRGDTTWTITVNSSTAYSLGAKAGARSDVTVGSEVLVQGAQGSGNALTAAAVRIQLPRVAGEVTAKSGNTLTVKRLDGTTIKVNVSSATTYKVQGVKDASLSDVTVGSMIVAEGSQNPDGSIDAATVFSGHHGPRKPPGRPFMPAPEASPTTPG